MSTVPASPGITQDKDATVATIGPFLGERHIAYFSMEIALDPRAHTYSGGLGMLAGDMARAACSMKGAEPVDAARAIDFDQHRVRTGA